MLYWASNWTAMTALGLVMETMLRIAGPLGFPFFLLFCRSDLQSINLIIRLVNLV